MSPAQINFEFMPGNITCFLQVSELLQWEALSAAARRSTLVAGTWWETLRRDTPNLVVGPDAVVGVDGLRDLKRLVTFASRVSVPEPVRLSSPGEVERMGGVLQRLAAKGAWASVHLARFFFEELGPGPHQGSLAQGSSVARLAIEPCNAASAKLQLALCWQGQAMQVLTQLSPRAPTKVGYSVDMQALAPELLFQMRGAPVLPERACLCATGLSATRVPREQLAAALRRGLLCVVAIASAPLGPSAETSTIAALQLDSGTHGARPCIRTLA